MGKIHLYCGLVRRIILYGKIGELRPFLEKELTQEMDAPKLKITPKKYVEDTTVISMRLPKDMLAELDKVAAATGRTRNDILTMGLEFALSHMEITEKLK